MSPVVQTILNKSVLALVIISTMVVPVAMGGFVGYVLGSQHHVSVQGRQPQSADKVFKPPEISQAYHQHLPKNA